MTAGHGGGTTEEAWAEERLAEIREIVAGLHGLARGKQPGAVMAACLQTAAELIAWFCPVSRHRPWLTRAGLAIWPAFMAGWMGCGA
jgi:hypothetical protein